MTQVHQVYGTIEPGLYIFARMVNLKKDRSIISVYPEGIEVIIPAKKSLFVNCFLAFWLLAWVYGEAVIISRLLSIDGQTPDAYIVFFACGWTFSGMLAILVWLWNNKGLEIIRISNSELKRSREYGLFSRSKIYQAKYISNLRVSDLSPTSLEVGGGMEFWGLSGGTITFDYEPGIAKIGLGLDEAEAGHIIQIINARYENLN